MFRTEQRAKRKAIKDKRCRQQRTSSPRWPSSYQSSASIHSSFSNLLAGYLPVLRDFGNFHGLSPCFKIAIKFISSFVWNFHQIFISYVFWFACIAFTTKAIIQYSLWFVVSGSHFAYVAINTAKFLWREMINDWLFDLLLQVIPQITHIAYCVCYRSD